MEMNLISKDKTSMKMEIVGLDETTLHLLIEELLKDDSVLVANYSMGHPQLDKPTIYIKVKSGKPQAALKKASKGIAKEFTSALAVLEKKK